MLRIQNITLKTSHADLDFLSNLFKRALAVLAEISHIFAISLVLISFDVSNISRIAFIQGSSSKRMFVLNKNDGLGAKRIDRM